MGVNPIVAARNEEQWLSTFTDFRDHLQQEQEVTHQSWLRDQQRQARDGKLSEQRCSHLREALGPYWELLSVSGLSNNARYGELPCQNQDLEPLKDALAALSTDVPLERM